MKYLKKFEGFSTLPQEIVRNLNDICLELNDININTECEYFPKMLVSGSISGGYISVGMEKLDFTDYNDVLSWGDVSETIDRMIDYMKSENWKLSSLLIDGDNLINPEQWIDNLRNKEYYSFTGLTINFIEN